MPPITSLSVDADPPARPSSSRPLFQLAGFGRDDQQRARVDNARDADSMPPDQASLLAPWGLPVDKNLLSPPLSVKSMDTRPFKAAETDRVSLSMKQNRHVRSKRYRGKQNWAATEYADEPTAPRPLDRQRLFRTSMPDLRQDITLSGYPSAAGQHLMRQELQALHIASRRASTARDLSYKRRASLPQKSRRWTVPSKAASTRVLSDSPPARITTHILPGNITDSVVPHLSLQGSPYSPSQSMVGDVGERPPTPTQTPAMITLKRATSKKRNPMLIRKTSLRPNAIISFPPPKFHRTTSTYFSSLFYRLSRNQQANETEPIETRVRQSSWNKGQDWGASSRKASVTKDNVQITSNTVAAPAFTQVDLLPQLTHSHMSAEEVLASSAKRYSTTIVSGASVHEIIWDENVTSSSEGSTRPQVSRSSSRSALDPGHSKYCRRRSVLVDKLQAQLDTHEQETIAQGFRCSNENEASSSTRGEEGQSQFRRLSKWAIWGADGTENVWQNSVSAAPLKPILDHDLTRTEAGALSENAVEDPTFTAKPVAYFPPLEGSSGNVSHRQSICATVRRRSYSNPEPSAAVKVACQTQSGSNGKCRNKGSQMGSAIGQSSHSRRKSMDTAKSKNKWPTRNFSKSWLQRDGDGSAEDDHDLFPLPRDEWNLDKPGVFVSEWLYYDGHQAQDPAWDAYDGDSPEDAEIGLKRLSVQHLIREIE